MQFQKGHKQLNTGRTHFKKGRIVSETERKMMSERTSERNLKMGIKPPSNLGKKFSINHREKLSKAHIINGNTPLFKIIRHSIEFRLWREAVFARDNWTCQKYGIKGGILRPHHIQNFSQFPELRFAIDNGITFSDKAHREFHSKYGYKNNTKGQLEEFLTKI